VESTPRLSARVEQPFDLGMRIGYPTVLLPVSLKHLTEGQPFAVFDSIESLLFQLDPPRTIILDMAETLAIKDLALYGNVQSSNKTLSKAIFSTWTIAALQWKENLAYLQDAFKRRRFDAVARPGMLTYLPLIQLRHLIVSMRDHLPDAQEACEQMTSNQGSPAWLPPTTLGKTLAQIVTEIDKLEKRLNDEIHLIIGAVTVQDSDANKQQSERATLLTLLAAVYLPLTLVTGIFGMNIKDINDGSPSWRACGIVLAVVAAGTIVFVLAYRQWRVWRRGQQERERMGLGFLKDV
jgi:hypothetical protein